MPGSTAILRNCPYEPRHLKASAVLAFGPLLTIKCGREASSSMPSRYPSWTSLQLVGLDDYLATNHGS